MEGEGEREEEEGAGKRFKRHECAQEDARKERISSFY